MDHYNIPDPYRKSKAYYIKHYVCLWQVTGAEIVGHWDWSELEGNGNWYQEIILPAFENFTAATSFTTWSHGRGLLARSNPVQSAPNVLDDLQDHLSRLSITNDGLDSLTPDESEGESGYYVDEEWNTDDEAEEANAQDDMIKIIEGDW